MGALDGVQPAGGRLRRCARGTALPIARACSPRRGATVCASIAEAVQGARFVVSIVADDEATRAVMLGERGRRQRRARNGDRRLQHQHAGDGPRGRAGRRAARGSLTHRVGQVPQARNRELVFMVGGDARDRDGAPVVRRDGADDRARRRERRATIAVNNMLSGTMTAAMAEAVSIAQAAGVDPRRRRRRSSPKGRSRRGC